MIPPKSKPGPPFKYDWSQLRKPSKTKFIEGKSRESLLTAAKNYFRGTSQVEFTTRKVGRKYRIYRIK